LISEELREFRGVIRRWVTSEVAPHAAAVDAAPRFPEEAWSAYVKNGWVGLPFPSELGGEGAEALACAIFIEEVARACASSSLFAILSRLAMTPVLYWGSEELKQRYVPRVAAGEVQASYCLSEPGAGSDVASMTTTARREGEVYVLNGRKCWVSNAGMSELYTVFAKTDSSVGSHGISCFVVERDFGLEIGKLEKKLRSTAPAR
jgi:alkylation response protein AidB-like acyl-CoA dehydrogenase